MFRGVGRKLNKKTVSRVPAFKTSVLVLLIGAFVILSVFTFTCAGASTTQLVRVTVDSFVCTLSDDEGVGNDADMDRFFIWATAYNVNDTETMIGAENQPVFSWSTSGEWTVSVGGIFDATQYQPNSLDIVFDTEHYDYSKAKLVLKAYAREYDTLSANEEATVFWNITGEHFLDNDGKHSFTLSDFSDFGFTVNITITAHAPASFTFSPESPEYGKTVTFDASGSSDSDGTIVDYVWDFGDGTTASGRTATYSYASVGSYTVTLTITYNDNLTDTATKNVFVIATGIDIDEVPPVANAGNEMTVKDGSKVNFSAAGSSDNVGIVSYVWDFGDGNTGTGETVAHTYDTVGTYNVSLTVADAAGLHNTDTIVITVEAEEEDAAGFPYWILIPIILGAVVAVAVVWFFLKKRKPKEKVPKPAKIKVTVDPAEVLADGKSPSTITIELLDEEGKPVQALADTEIQLVSSMGKVKKPVVKILRGTESEKTVLVASKEAGTVTLSAVANGLERAVITVTFMEKKRYCMLCGAKMSFTAKSCPECNKAPPAGVDTKLCKNCGVVIPVVANFCPECGASQPKKE